MKATALITVVDENPVHQAALKLLIISSRLHKVDIPIFVLHPKNLPSNKLIAWLSKENIQAFSYSMTREDNDPYFTKFLIESFINSEQSSYNAYCYLDPDHLFLSDFALPRLESGEILIGSEEADELNVYGYASRHYNTSLIYGTLNTISWATKNWLDEYRLMKNIVDNRHREEIAFILSCRKTGALIRPINSSIQGNFKNSINNCSVFHYGGESKLSIQIKKFMASEMNIERLMAMKTEFIKPVEMTLFNELIKVTEKYSEW